MEISPVKERELVWVSFLESAIEGQGAASLQTISKRYQMFGDGFLVARKGGKIVGYLESCIWDIDPPRFEPESDFFARHHSEERSILYIIFVGVDQDARRRGIGSSLIKELICLAAKYQKIKIHAVCRDGLLPFYFSLGFKIKENIPGFLPDGANYNLMELLV